MATGTPLFAKDEKLARAEQELENAKKLGVGLIREKTDLQRQVSELERRYKAAEAKVNNAPADWKRQMDASKQALETAQKTITDQVAWIEDVKAAPAGIGTVKFLEGEFIILSTGGGLMRVKKPADREVKPGMQVVLNLETMAIIDTTTLPGLGPTGTVMRVIDAERVEVEVGGVNTVILSGEEALEEGMRVTIDRTGSLVTSIAERPRTVTKPSVRVTFDDIGGLEETKAKLREAIELPHKHPDLYSFYGRKPPKGLMLYGPPGCGKTMLGKAAATCLADIYTGNNAISAEAVESCFQYIKSPEVLNMYVGASEQGIRNIFNNAKRHKQKYGFPAVLFFDEADAVMGRRGAGGMNSIIDRTIVPTFLTEMDGMEDTGAIVILATNRPDSLDPAITRDGRIDEKIRVLRPDEKAVADIMRLELRGCPLHNDLDPAELAARLAKQFFSPKRILRSVTLIEELGGEQLNVPLSALSSGAIAAGVIQRGKGIALRRDLAAETRIGGIEKDFLSALEDTQATNSMLMNEDAVIEWLIDNLPHAKAVGTKNLVASTPSRMN